MSDPAASVPYEAVLAELLGWVGQRVAVGIATSGDEPVMIAHLAGVLAAGSEVSEADHEGAVFFHMEDGGTGFLLSPETYAGAGWSAESDGALVVRLGAVSLWIELDESS